MGDSRRSKNACKHTYEAFKTIISLTIKLSHFSLKITRMRSRRRVKKEHVCRSVSLDGQGHSPRPRGEDLLWQLYSYDRLQYGIQHLEAKTSTDSHHCHRRKEEENLHTKSYKAMLEQLRSARLTRCDQAVRLLNMQRLQVVRDT
jgi:hypothetical protein